MSKLKLCEEGNHYVVSLFWAKRRDRKSACRQCAMKYAKPLKSNPKIKSVDNWNPLNEGIGVSKISVNTSSDKLKKTKIYKYIKTISDKQSKLLKEYRVVRDEYMKNHPFCEICGAKSQDLHHKAGRGKHLSSTEYFMALCRLCHQKIEEMGEEVYTLGFKIKRTEI